jgi:hypothetical protein
VATAPVRTVAWERAHAYAVDRPMGFDDPAGIKRCVLGLPGLRAEDVQRGHGVTILAQAGGVRVSVDRRGTTSRPRHGGEELPLEARRALREVAGIQSGHPKIRARARTIAGDATAPREVARRIALWVHRELKTRDAVADDALSILLARRGNCTGRSRLAVALARSLGIPSQEVSGIAYQGDVERRFVAHGWVRLFIGGRWIEMDPTWGQLETDATHIRLVRGALGRLQGKTIKVESVGEGPGEPDKGAKGRFLDRLEYAARNNDAAFIKHSLQLKPRAKRALAGQSLGKILCRGGNLKVVRGRRRGDKRFILRLVGGGGDLSYFELVLRRIPAGPVKIVDLRKLTGAGGGLQTVQGIRRLARRVGGDPYLKKLEGDVLLGEGKTARALAAYRRAVRADPEMLQAQDALARVLARLKRWGALVKQLRVLKRRFDFDVHDLSDPVFAEFIKTPRYLAFLEALK